MKKATEEYGVGGGNTEFLRFESSGDFKIRVLTPGYPMGTYFYGKGTKPRIAYSEMPDELKPTDPETGEKAKPNVKFVCYVIDRADNNIKLAELPWTVVKAITNYQEDEDFAFDDFPMPFDIKVTFKKDAAPAEKYTVLPNPNRTELTEEMHAAFEEKMEAMTPEQYIEKRKEKQRIADASESQLDDPSNQSGYEYPNGPEEEVPW